MIYSTLSNGVTIPGIGFGCYKLPEENGVDVLLSAIQAGYRHFDTASFYGTEKAGRSFSSPPSCGRIRWTTPWPPSAPRCRPWGRTTWTCI